MRFLAAWLFTGSVFVLPTAATFSNASTTWRLRDNYSGFDFLSKFTHQNIPDPTHGRVTYVDERTALRNNLSWADWDTFVMRADYKTVLDPDGPGRMSVRLRSKKKYTEHVLVADVRHMPEGLATWPAMWEVLEEGWPAGGEVDIIEGVNDKGPNKATLHTSPNCTMPPVRDQTGTPAFDNCDAAVNYNAGCGVYMPTANSYGPEFNRNGGGHFVMERTEQSFKVWFFPRGTAPWQVVDKQCRTFDTSALGTPTAYFPNTQCDFASKFSGNNIIINLTLCGDWAGQADVWAATGQNGTCAEYVDNNPAAFKNAFWDIAGIRVYE